MNKFCINCVYEHHVNTAIPKCYHPSLGRNPVTGQQNSEYCSVMRTDVIYSKDFRCETEGKLFIQREPEPPKKSFLQKLFEIKIAK